MVSLSHLVAGFLLTAGIGRPSAVSRYTQSRSSVNRVYAAVAVVFLHDMTANIITKPKESCKQGSTLHRRQQNRIELYALVNPKPK